MFARIAIAAVGALIVTGSLLLAMDTLTSLFENERGERVFRISDILEKPDPGRPQRPLPAARRPIQQAVEADDLDASIPIEAPAPVETEDLVLPAPAVEAPPASAN